MIVKVPQLSRDEINVSIENEVSIKKKILKIKF